MKPERIEVYWQGLITGLVGYATVAIVMAVVNMVLGRTPLFTPALLGSAIFYGLEDPSQLSIQAGPVLAYNGLHLVIFLALGIMAAWFALLSERGPHLWYVGMVGMLFVVFHLFGVLLFVKGPIRAALSPWAMLLSGFLAMIAMSAYLVGTHPKLRSELRDFAAQDADLADGEA